MQNSAITHAIEIVSRAIAADNGGDYEAALSLYRNALGLFTIGIRHEKDEVKKKHLIRRTEEYMKRAEDLRDYLNSNTRPGAGKSGGSPGAKGSVGGAGAKLKGSGAVGVAPGVNPHSYVKQALPPARRPLPQPQGKRKEKARIEKPSLELPACGVCEDGLLPSKRLQRTRYQDLVERDKNFLLAILILVVVMNVPFGKYLLYPFSLFSTWVHEMCHGIAAVLMGGSISKIKLYPDGSGVCYTSLRGKFAYGARRVVVASAGYTGTAFAGGVLLMLRRTRRGPRRTVFGVAVVALLSAVLFIRNAFGFVEMTLIGAALGVCGWWLDPGPVALLHSFLAATCCLNAVTSIQNIMTDRDCVSGENRANDAQTVAEYTHVPYMFWVVLWLVFAVAMLAVGLLFPVEPSGGLPSAPYAERDKDTICGRVLD